MESDNTVSGATYRNAFIWNAIAGIVNALEAVLMTAIVTRVTNIEDAGILTIAFALGNLFMTIGKFGVRNYQVTDAYNTFCFVDYLRFRVYTVLLMILVSCLYLSKFYLDGSYSVSKTVSIAAICGIYCIESIEDVFAGEFQRKGRLDLGGKFFCLRWVLILITFGTAIWGSRKLYISLWAGFFVSAVVLILLICFFYRYYSSSFGVDKLFKAGMWKELFPLFKGSFPLFATAFLTFYLNNSPKYAIDGILDENAQACYGFVAMPVFVTGLLNSFIYQPTLVSLSNEWENRTVKFTQMIKRQFVILMGISMACIIGAATIGIPVLSILYSTDLSNYWNELVILQFAGMFLALSGYLQVVLTVMRHQKILMWAYAVASVFAVSIMNFSVLKIGTIGAAFTYLISMVFLCVVYMISFLFYYTKDRNEGEEK